MKKLKKIDKSNPENENQVKMEIEANKLATYFEKNINASKLARWLSNTNCDLRDYSVDGGKDAGANHFLWLIGWDLLPQLINCKNKEERIKSLKKTIPQVFDSGLYEGSKSALVEIGRCFLKPFEKLSHDQESILDFMNIYTHFLCMTEMYSEYAFYKKELSKAA